MLLITGDPLDVPQLSDGIADQTCGAVVSFEGRVRNHHDGKEVLELRYECYRPMALREFGRIREEALDRWKLHDLWIAHRIGFIPLGEAAAWVGAASSHRKESFQACAWAMDEIKSRTPIWKKETYADGTQSWVEDACGRVGRRHE